MNQVRHILRNSDCPPSHLFLPQSVTIAINGLESDVPQMKFRFQSLTALACVTGIIWGSVSLNGQSTQPNSPAQSDAQHRISVNSDLVVLPTTVKDRKGNLVAGLEQQDFRVFDDDSEQTIEVFASDASTLSLVVLVDDDLKDKDAAQMAPSLRTIVAGVSLTDEAMVCRFDVQFQCGATFTSDSDQLLTVLKEAQEVGGPSKTGPLPVFMKAPQPRQASGAIGPAPVDLGSAPTKALDDAVFAAAELLKPRDRSRRKVILLISDGINGREFNRHTFEETRNALLSDNISVFSVVVGSNTFHSRFELMRDYANDSGGDIYFATKKEQMEKLYSQITEQARHEYTLAYVPKVRSTTPDYHTVRVEMLREGLTAETRRGYYASSRTDVPNK